MYKMGVPMSSPLDSQRDEDIPQRADIKTSLHTCAGLICIRSPAGGYGNTPPWLLWGRCGGHGHVHVTPVCVCVWLPAAGAHRLWDGPEHISQSKGDVCILFFLIPFPSRELAGSLWTPRCHCPADALPCRATSLRGGVWGSPEHRAPGAVPLEQSCPALAGAPPGRPGRRWPGHSGMFQMKEG